MTVSVVIINYNQCRFLGDAIRSVLAQTVRPDEILLVDDGSTDTSLAHASLFSDRVRIISKPNGGQVSAFNLGFKESTGDFIALLEADDTWYPNKLSRCLKILTEDPAVDLVQHWLTQTNAEGQSLPGYSYDDSRTHITLSETLNGNIPYAGTSCIVFRRSALAPFLPLPENLLYGADICLRLIASSLWDIANIPKCLGTRRHHGSNLFGETLYDSKGKIEMALEFHTELAFFQIKFLTERHIEIPKNWCNVLQLEQMKLDLFHSRYEHNFINAFLCFLCLVATSGFRFKTIFLATTLAIALVSPMAYVKLHRVYSRMRRC